MRQRYSLLNDGGLVVTTVSFEEFKKLDIRIAKVTKVEDHPNADKLYLIKADVGEGPDGATLEKTFVAGIKNFYSKEELIGKLLVIINNLEPVTIRGITSNAMLLAASDKNKKHIVILTSDKPIDAGSKVS